MDDEMLILATTSWYQGRLWDAPFTDDSMPADLSGQACTWCQEPISKKDDAVKMTNIVAHLECHLRSCLGDVQHLEQRCICYDQEVVLDTDTYLNYRDQSRAVLRWMIDHRQGRFHD